MRYFIHIVAGAESLVDHAGADYKDLAAARAEALRGARELVADRLRFGDDGAPDGVVEILDERGNICDLITFDEVVFGSSRRQRHRQVFDTVNHNYLLLSPDLTIIEANRAYLAATMTDLAAISRRFLFDVFPDNPDVPESNGARKLADSLQQVLTEKSVQTMPTQRYDIRARDGAWIERHWLPVNYPVLDDQGEVEFIIHQIQDVTPR